MNTGTRKDEYVNSEKTKLSLIIGTNIYPDQFIQAPH